MALKLDLFKPVAPVHLSKLAKDIKDIISKDTLSLILNAYVAKIRSENSLDDSEMKCLLDWYAKIQIDDKSTVTTYLDSHLENEISFSEVAQDYLDTLRLPDVVEVLVSSQYIQQRMNEKQKKSFSDFIKKEINSKKHSVHILLAYVENLYLVASEKFTVGQKSQSQSFLFDADFSPLFENEFERLLSFLVKSELEYPNVVVQTLDKQLGRLIAAHEAEVTAKAYNQKLGYQKYIKLIESIPKININILPNYKKLKSLVSKFEEAVNILAEKEPVRGHFWKMHVSKVDAIRFKKVNNPQYKVAVAFYVGNFVFCDYGPTGNKIFIYDRDDFDSKIQGFGNWKVDTLLTSRLYPSSYAHLGDWQRRTLQLMAEARRR